MSNLFLNTIIQYGGNLSDSDKILILNIVSQNINKKMKKIEYKYEVKIKIDKLPENNSDCLPKRIGIQTFAQIEGPYKGQIPIYTTAEIAIPTPYATAVTTAYPLTPYGPYVGIPGIAINPFGQPPDRLGDRIKKAEYTLIKIKEIDDHLKNINCKDIIDVDIKKYIECVDLEFEEDKINEGMDQLNT